MIISLTDAKAHLVVEHDNDDTLITTMIDSAVAFVANATGRTILESTVTQTLDGFPAGDILLQRTPVQEVTAVTYQDPDGVQQSMVLDDVRIDDRHLKVRLYPVDDWPTTSGKRQSVTVVYTAGYSADNYPADLRAAALLVLGSLYDNRENDVKGVSVSELPLSARLLMAPYVIPVAS